jgi:hypothetical protein
MKPRKFNVTIAQQIDGRWRILLSYVTRTGVVRGWFMSDAIFATAEEAKQAVLELRTDQQSSTLAEDRIKGDRQRSAINR